MLSTPAAFRARWVFPVAQPPISGGYVQTDQGRITHVGPTCDLPAGQITDLGNAALLPGLVNAHVHLEFSDRVEPLGTSGMEFSAWIRNVIHWKRSRAAAALAGGLTPDEAAIVAGLQESHAAGTVALGEISNLPPPHYAAAYTGWRGQITLFAECLGLLPDREPAVLHLAETALQTWPSGGDGLPPNRLASGDWPPPAIGLSPHAPYTVSLDLVEKLCALAQASGAPVAMHVAESEAEMELLATHAGPLRELLDSLGVWSPHAFAAGTQPLEYLTRLARAPRALVIHGNHLNPVECAFLAQRPQMTLVHCPRTHDFFGRGAFPLRQLLDQQVSLALGTDGRGSNPDLNLWNEMRFLAGHDRHVSPEEILRLGTYRGAQALGLTSLGSLAPGQQAALLALELPPATGASDPHELLFSAAATPYRLQVEEPPHPVS